MAVLGGDSVTFSGMRMLAELGGREVLAAIIAGEQMCAGMVREAADLYVGSRSEQSYLDTIDGKTAALLSLACRVGAMQAGRPDDQEEALAEFGRHFGLAYQLYDDILDLARREHLTVYDTIYLWAAARGGFTLASRDADLLAAALRNGVAVNDLRA